VTRKYPFFRFLRTLDGLGMIRSELKSQELFLRKGFELMSETIAAHVDNFLWYTLFVPAEIIHGMDAIAIESDTMGVYLATFGYLKMLMNHVDQELGLANICVYHKALIGALHLEIIPPPKGIIVNGSCCDTARKLGSYIQRMFGAQLFVLDTPSQKTPASLAYLRGQLIEMTRFIERLSGKKLDIDRLREAVRRSNEATAFWKRAQDLRRGRPLLKGIAVQSRFINATSTFGSPYAVDVARMFYEELQERLERGEPRLQDGCRLMWVHNLPQYKTFFDRLEDEMGASVVVEVLAYPYYDRLDEEDPFASIADRMLSHPVVGTNDFKAQYLRELAQRFRVDGTIQLLQTNCRTNYGLSRCVADGLRLANIPTLHLDMDSLDKRCYSEEQVKTRVQGFVESLSMRQAAMRLAASRAGAR
jgi:benzoyl-CoA reductase/2-hydroxyglutaryl-CoA dehydratase subunit BcrC/BadD/HgdB